MNIVLVHGIWDNGRVFNRMSEYLTNQGHTCFAPDLKPSDARHGLIDLAEKFEKAISKQFDHNDRFALIGFSMGTLISRYYLQKLGGLKQATSFFSISGPHHGTLTAHAWLGKAARDMRFGSAFLKELNRDTKDLKTLPTVTYRTPFELMILPSTSSKLDWAENEIAYALFHHRMLIQKRVYDDIARRLANQS